MSSQKASEAKSKRSQEGSLITFIEGRNIYIFSIRRLSRTESLHFRS